MSLTHLVAEAVALGGGNLCASGHAWEAAGGRACPLPEAGPLCSQAVFQCGRCGEFDYGEPGGPGADDCAECAHKTAMGKDSK